VNLAGCLTRRWSWRVLEKPSAALTAGAVGEQRKE